MLPSDLAPSFLPGVGCLFSAWDAIGLTGRSEELWVGAGPSPLEVRAQDEGTKETLLPRRMNWAPVTVYRLSHSVVLKLTPALFAIEEAEAHVVVPGGSALRGAAGGEKVVHKQHAERKIRPTCLAPLFPTL